MINDQVLNEKIESSEMEKLQQQLFRYAEDLHNLVQMQKALESLLGVVADGYLITDIRGSILGADRNGQALLKLDDIKMDGQRNISEFIHHGSQAELAALLQLMEKSSSGPVHMDAHLTRTLDDLVRWHCVMATTSGQRSMEAHIWRINSLSNQPALAWVFKDKTSNEALEYENRMALSVYRNTRDAIMMTDLDGTIVSVNPAFTGITGWGEDEVLGKTPRILNSGRQDTQFYRSFFMTLKTFGLWRGEIWNKRKNGEIYQEWLSVSTARDADGNAHGYIAVFTDLSGLTAEQEGNRDGMTGLLNHAGMVKETNSLIALTESQSAPLIISVIVLVVDGFEMFNQEHGHGRTEELLVAVARRLEELLPRESIIARLEDGAFSTLLTYSNDVSYAGMVAAKLTVAFSQPVIAGDDRFSVSIKIGTATYPHDSLDAEALIQSARNSAS